MSASDESNLRLIASWLSRDGNREAKDFLLRLADNLESDRKDAARYRYLRDECVPIDGYHHLQHSKEDCDRRIDERIERK